MRIRTFRARLTLWHLAFFSLLFVLSGVFLYGVLSRALVRQLDDTISAEAATAANLFADEIHELQGDIVHAAPEALSGLRLRAGSAAIFDGARMLASAPPRDPKEFDPLLMPGRHVAWQPITIDGHSYLIAVMEP